MKKHLSSYSIYNEMHSENSLSKKIDWKFVQYVYDVLLKYMDDGLPFSLDMETTNQTLLMQNFKLIDDDITSASVLDTFKKNGPVWEITLDFGHVHKYYSREYKRDYKKYKLIFDNIIKRIQSKYNLEIVNDFEAIPYRDIKFGLDYSVSFKIIK